MRTFQSCSAFHLQGPFSQTGSPLCLKPKLLPNCRAPCELGCIITAYPTWPVVVVSISEAPALCLRWDDGALLCGGSEPSALGKDSIVPAQWFHWCAPLGTTHDIEFLSSVIILCVFFF